MQQDSDWFSPEAATFGDRVAAAREQAGMTQAQLAKRLGVKAVTLRHWEEDLSEPRANRLSMLAGLLNVSMMWLINGTGEGVDVAEGGSPDVADLNAVLTDLRDLRADLLNQAEQAGRLEKRLRKILAEGRG